MDSRAQHGIQLASEKTSLADQHAADAATKAQMAQTRPPQATTRVSTAEQMVGNLDQYKASAQTEILFRAGQTALSKQAKDALDEMAAPLKRSAQLHRRSARDTRQAARRLPPPRRRRWPTRWCDIWCSTIRFRSTAFMCMSLGNTPVEGSRRQARAAADGLRST